jgi:hypothetical protein
MLRAPGLVVLALLASTASAAPEPPSSKPKPVVVPVPSIAVDAKTDGTADLTLSGGLLLYLTEHWTIAPQLTFKATSSDGVGTLFSWTNTKKDKTPPPWSLGMSVVLTQFPDRTRDQTIDDIKASAYRKCRKVCAANPVPSGCEPYTTKRGTELAGDRAEWRLSTARDMKPKDFCAGQQRKAEDLKAREDAQEVSAEEAMQARANLLGECLKDCDDPAVNDLYCDGARSHEYPMETQGRRFEDADFCPDGRGLLKAYRKTPASEDLVTRNPSFRIKLGGRLGRAQFKTLWPDASAPPGQFVPRTVVRTPATAGASFARILGGGRRSFTMEGLLVYDRSFAAPTKTARWCVPAGTVSGQPAETCTELPLGAPDEKGTFRLAAYGGYLDQVANSWRVAGGIDALLYRGGGSDVSVVLPVWVSFAGTDGKYLGVARFTPSFTWSTDANGKATQQALLSVALLGQPTLFSPEFDRL